MTGLEPGAGFGHVFGPGVAVGPEVESDSVAGTEPEPGDGVGFGPESEPEAVTEPGAEVGSGDVAESGAGFEMKLVPEGGTGVGPLTGVGPGLGPEPGSHSGLGTETAPEVGFEQGAVLGLGVHAAETELGLAGGFGLVLWTGDALEPECVALAGLDQRAGPESGHRFGLGAGVVVEYWFGAGAEDGGVSQ